MAINVENKTPLVSVCCITYNHAPFIRQSLEGMLVQKLDLSALPLREEYEVGFEILIHDDYSTDGTTEIVKEYAAKYPDIIKPLYETENQYSKGVWVDGYNYRRAQGKYIAYCEGDDYWTDPLKLQKQVEFMEAHPEYSICFSTFRNHVVKTDEYLETDPTRLLKANGNPEGMDIDLDLYFQKWYTQPMTMLFRFSAFSFDWQKQYKHYRDMHEIYHLLKAGKGRLINFDGGVRNVHGGGISSQISQQRYCELSLPMDGEFWVKNKGDEGPKGTYIETLDTSIKVYASINKIKALGLCIERYKVSKALPRLYHQVKFVLFGKE